MTAGVDSHSTRTTDGRSVIYTDHNTTFGLPGRPVEFLAGSRLSTNERNGQRVPVEDLGDLTVAIFNHLAHMNDHRSVAKIVVSQHSIRLEIGKDLPGVPEYMCRLLDLAIEFAKRNTSAS